MPLMSFKISPMNKTLALEKLFVSKFCPKPNTLVLRPILISFCAVAQECSQTAEDETGELDLSGLDDGELDKVSRSNLLAS